MSEVIGGSAFWLGEALVFGAGGNTAPHEHKEGRTNRFHN